MNTAHFCFIRSEEKQLKDVSIAVAIPCYNEAVTIAKVVKDFQRALPNAVIHVFDNNSTDGSANLAKTAGAVVHHVYKQGKGNVMSAILNTIDADIIVVADGDDTYEAAEAPILLEPILKGRAEMVVGNRLPNASADSLKTLHRIGNRMIVAAINFMFGTDYQDILSGYRVFSRRFIECVPLLKPGFETETEIILQHPGKIFFVRVIRTSRNNGAVWFAVGDERKIQKLLFGTAENKRTVQDEDFVLPFF